jgi:hypothetical protein
MACERINEIKVDLPNIIADFIKSYIKNYGLKNTRKITGMAVNILRNSIPNETLGNLIVSPIERIIENVYLSCTNLIAESSRKYTKDLITEYFGVNPNRDIENLEKLLVSLEKNLITSNFNEESIKEYENRIQNKIEFIKGKSTYKDRANMLFILLATESRFNLSGKQKINYVFNYLKKLNISEEVNEIDKKYNEAINLFKNSVLNYEEGKHLSSWLNWRSYIPSITIFHYGVYYSVHPEKINIMKESICEIEKIDIINRTLKLAQNYKNNLQVEEGKKTFNSGEADRIINQLINALQSIIIEINEKNDPCLARYLNEYNDTIVEDLNSSLTNNYINLNEDTLYNLGNELFNFVRNYYRNVQKNEKNTEKQVQPNNEISTQDGNDSQKIQVEDKLENFSDGSPNSQIFHTPLEKTTTETSNLRQLNEFNAPAIKQPKPEQQLQEEASQYYAEGKAAFYQKDTTNTIKFFQLAKDKYKNALDIPEIDQKDRAKIEHRLAKLKNPDGKYSPIKLIK